MITCFANENGACSHWAFRIAIAFSSLPTQNGFRQRGSSALEEPLAASAENMGKKISEMKDWMRPEYDLSELTVVARGPGRKTQTANTTRLTWMP